MTTIRRRASSTRSRSTSPGRKISTRTISSASRFSQRQVLAVATAVEFEEAQQFEYTEVRAPIAGTITLRDVKVGDQVGSGRVQEIIDFESIVAVIHVPEQYLPDPSDMEQADLQHARR